MTEDYKNYYYKATVQDLQNDRSEDTQKWAHSLNWDLLTQCADIPEDVLIQYQHLINWKNVSAYQQLSEDFVRAFIKHLDIQKLRRNPNLTGIMTDEFIIELQLRGLI